MAHEHISLDGMLDRALRAGSMTHDEICRAVNLVFTASPITTGHVQQRAAKIAQYQRQLESLKALPVIEQRSPEWYAARQCIVTASDLAQALGEGKFGTQKQFFQKKCGHEPEAPFNTAAPALKHGVMAEPIICEIYERRNGMRVHEFGLLRHPTISHFGASPDGITDCGVMLEIKAPFKRKITGEIPWQYLLQMQGQLEVTGLDEVDYCECDIAMQDYFAPVAMGADSSSSTSTRTETQKQSQTQTEQAAGEQALQEHGVFAEYSNPDRYVYKLLDDQRSVEEWLHSIGPGYSKIWAWQLKKYSVIRVYRDDALIQQKLRELEAVWQRVLRYREDKALYSKEVAPPATQALTGTDTKDTRDKDKACYGLQKITGYSFI